jgi:hypothetical protein
MKRPDLPLEHCANQSPEMAKKVFVQSIAPSLKSGSMDARGAISQLEIWREYHPEVFADWRELCLTYIQQPPEWVDWLIQGVKATSEEVVEADKLVAAGTAVMAEKHAQQMLALEHPQFAQAGNNQHTLKDGRDNVTTRSVNDGGNSAAYLAARLKKAQRDDLLAETGPGKRFKSVRAAAIEAGIITPFPSLQLKEPAPTAQKLLDKMGQAWCLQLLEELSELCL